MLDGHQPPVISLRSHGIEGVTLLLPRLASRHCVAGTLDSLVIRRVINLDRAEILKGATGRLDDTGGDG